MANQNLTKQAKGSNSISSIYNKFGKNIHSAYSYFSKFGNLATVEDTSSLQSISDQLKVHSEQISQEIERLKKNPVNEGKAEGDKLIADRRFEIFLKSITKNWPKFDQKNFDILSQGTFLMINNYFEYLLADLLTYFHTKYRYSLNNKQFSVSLQELTEYETSDEILTHLILKEVESLMIEKSFDQLLDYFESFLKISKEKEIINWDCINEIRERRHLIVHNSSIVNKKYLIRTKNPHSFNIGDNIDIDENYFNNSIKQIDIAGKILCLNAWIKWDEENIDGAFEALNYATFDCLKHEDYLTTIQLWNYCKNFKTSNPHQEDSLLRTKFNMGVALKKLNRTDELNQLLKECHVGTSSPIFKLAHQILADDHTDIDTNFRNALTVDKLTLDKYEDWPIFDFLRIDEHLNNRITEILKEAQEAVLSENTSLTLDFKRSLK